MAIIKFNSVDGFSVGTSETTVIDGSGNISAVGATFTGSISIGGVGITSVVTSVNSITGPVTIAQGSNVTVSTVGSTITIASSGGGSSPPLATSSITGVASFGSEFVVSAAGAVSLTSNYVTSVNSITGPVTIAQGSNVTVSTVGSTITISSSAGGGGSSPLATTTGVTGVASFNPNDFSVSVTGTVSITGSYQTSLSRPFLFSGM